MTGDTDATDVDDSRLHHVVGLDELAPGDRVVVDVLEREIAVFNLDGEIHALSNFCVHQGGPACEGQISGTLGESDRGRLSYERDDELVSCPWHGWVFEIETGRHLARPEKYRLPSYDTIVRDGEVYVVL